LQDVAFFYHLVLAEVWLSDLFIIISFFCFIILAVMCCNVVGLVRLSACF